MIKNNDMYIFRKIKEDEASCYSYGLVDSKTNEILCAAVLLEDDNSWEDNEPSIYIHNFISKIGYPGIGKLFIKYTEEYAKLNGKKYLRLDSSGDNKKLTEYYDEQGFIPVGTCVYVDGLYKGVLRQKEL
ncbi:hypothetical protein BCR36DRAFT_404918 [Piromyces finnis]|uniref:N-acetyltransferase domain-containing protein n=1 Tax=Piromyces finnis TaxID=1754191 RepID=A0A1Y1V7J6_9FUNG|nr:hypothetical protein BCR36DRAFT_404918 [Piromyces finnis]|eukprot:ORX49000.1 hypothetical protein BCR36DRAFT_404918 [Piromyces finnis]